MNRYFNPQVLPARVEARDDRILAQQEATDDALEAAIKRAAEDMDMRDVFNELCELDPNRLALLMLAYRERHNSADERAYYLWLLDDLFDTAAVKAAEGIARRRMQSARCVRLFDES